MSAPSMIGWENFGLRWALEQYDQKFSMTDNSYDASAKLALWLEPVGDSTTILEVGAGTGISTVALIEASPRLEKLCAIEPADAIQVAMHKFSHIALFDGDDPKIINAKLGVSLSDDYIRHLAGIRKRMRGYKDKIEFIQAPAQSLEQKVAEGTVAKGSIDKVYCLSSFHWLACCPETGVISPENVSSSLKGLYKALAPDGLLVFNMSGLQFEHDQIIFQYPGQHPVIDRFNGMSLNDIHTLQNPFHVKFIEVLNEILGSQYHLGVRLNPARIDDYHFLFNLASLNCVLESNGFRLKTLPFKRQSIPKSGGFDSISYVPKPNKYLFTLMPKQPEDWERFIVVGGNMRYFNHPQLRGIRIEDRIRILREAYSKASCQYASLMHLPHGETFVTFVAEKSG